MKKFLTLIAVICGIIPALHGMDTNLPADVQKQYDNLTMLIQNADIEAFKPSFDALTLPTENIAALRQTIAETKAAITNELESMGDKTKSWSKIIKGGLATFLSGWAGLAVPATGSIIFHLFNDKTLDSGNSLVLHLGAGLPALIPSVIIIKGIERIKKPYIVQGPDKFCILAASALACLGAAYKGLPYGIKTFKAGLNYKEHLQNMLIDLDAIDAHIAQPKA